MGKASSSSNRTIFQRLKSLSLFRAFLKNDGSDGSRPELPTPKLQFDYIKTLEAEKLRALGEMAAGVAHEINNPLAIILGKTQSMKLLAKKGKLTEQIQDAGYAKIEETVFRISKIVNNLRKLSKESHEEEFATIPIQELIEDVLIFWNARLHNYNINLDLHVPVEKSFVRCRPTQVTQAIFNVIMNSFQAIKNLPEETEKKIGIKADVIDGKVQLQICDSGQGIPTEIQHRIFDPFFTTQDPGAGGVGLGLPIAKAIMDSNFGSLEFDNKKSPSCFVLTLRLATIEEMPKRSAA